MYYFCTADHVTWLLNLSSCTPCAKVGQYAEQAIEMSTRNLPGVKGGRPAREADKLTTICEPIV
jgi:hypothetical protein